MFSIGGTLTSLPVIIYWSAFLMKSACADTIIPSLFFCFEYIFNQIKSNQITFIVTSPQHKCLGEWNSYERAPDSAEKQQTIYIWTDSPKKQQTIYIWTDSAKKQQTIYIWTDSAKNCTGAFTVLQTVQKNNNSNLHMDRQCKKKQQQQFTYGQTVQKKQQQFTYGQYIFTDCTEDNVQNTHTCTQYA